jgi:hypothetical protein
MASRPNSSRPEKNAMPSAALDRNREADETRRDRTEILIGSVGIILFGISLTVWPSFAEFIDRFVFSYVTELVDLVRESVF